MANVSSETMRERIMEWSKEKIDDLQRFQAAYLDSVARLEKFAPQQMPARSESAVATKEPGSVAPAQIHAKAPAEKWRDPYPISIDFKVEMPRDYYLVKGRLRLGKPRSAIAAALCCLLSGGLSLFVWGPHVRREIAWHLGQDCFRVWRPWCLAFLPVAHILGCYYLGAKLQALEKQNGYRSTSSVLAAGLAIFPPFVVGYIQKRLNKHWQLHAEHAMRVGLV